MKTSGKRFGLDDMDYLQRCKKSTPEQRLDWLAAAQEFAHTPKRKIERKR